MMPNSRIAAFTIFELLTENHHGEVGGGIKLLCQELFIRFGFPGYKPSSAIVKFSFKLLIVTIVDV